MFPVDFDGANKTLTAPKGIDNCGDLKVFTDGHECISCWGMSLDELKEVVRDERIFISVLNGITQPPIRIMTLSQANDLMVTMDKGVEFDRMMASVDSVVKENPETPREKAMQDLIKRLSGYTKFLKELNDDKH